VFWLDIGLLGFLCVGCALCLSVVVFLDYSSLLGLCGMCISGMYCGYCRIVCNFVLDIMICYVSYCEEVCKVAVCACSGLLYYPWGVACWACVWSAS